MKRQYEVFHVDASKGNILAIVPDDYFTSLCVVRASSGDAAVRRARALHHIQRRVPLAYAVVEMDGDA